MKREELRGKTDYDIFSKEVADYYRKNDRQVLENKQPIQTEEIFDSPDGKKYTLLANKFPLFNASGEVIASCGISTDITERKKTEEELKSLNAELEQRVRQRTAQVENERKRLFDVLERLPAMVCLLTPDHHVAFANRSFRDKFGESEGRYCYDYCFGNKEPCSFCESYKALETGSPHHWQVKGTDGSVIDAHDYPFTDVDGSPLVLEMDMDITEQKRNAEELEKYRKQLEHLVKERTAELLETRDYLNNLLDYANAPIIVWNPQFRITSFNHAFEKLTGLTAAEAVGRDIDILFPLDKKREAMTYIRSTLTGKFWESVEIPIQHKEGTFRILLWNSANIYGTNGQMIATIAQGQDITERKKAEEALRESEEQLRRAIEEAPIPVIMHAEDGQVLQISRTWTELTGYAIKDIRSFGEWLTKAVYGEGADNVRDHMHQLFSGNARSVNVDFTLHTAKGEERHWIFSASAPGKLRDGRRFIVGMAVDVTEREKAEEHLREAERFAAIGRTAAMVGHDLRNPLQGMVGYLSLADEVISQITCKPEKRQELRESIAETRRLTYYMDKIVSDLQDYARPIKPSLKPVNLPQLVQRALSICDVRSNVSVSVKIPKSLTNVCVDPTIIERVLINLINNALQAMPDGGKLTIACSSKGSFILEVEDTGVGIPEADRSKIFTPLFTTKAKGQGFGLAVCKRLIEAHGGTITFRSRDCQGTKFVLKLPLEKVKM
jgi:PAS domain S-box-containing protein